MKFMSVVIFTILAMPGIGHTQSKAIELPKLIEAFMVDSGSSRKWGQVNLCSRSNGYLLVLRANQVAVATCRAGVEQRVFYSMARKCSTFGNGWNQYCGKYL